MIPNIIKILSNEDISKELEEIVPEQVSALCSSNMYHSWIYGKNNVLWLPEMDIESAYYHCYIHNMFRQIDIGIIEPAITSGDKNGIIASALKLKDVCPLCNTEVDVNVTKLNNLNLDESDTQKNLFLSIGCDMENLYATACDRAFVVIETPDIIALSSLSYAAAFSSDVYGVPFCYSPKNIYKCKEYTIIEFIKSEVAEHVYELETPTDVNE